MTRGFIQNLGRFIFTIADAWQSKTSRHNKLFLSLKLFQIPHHDILVRKVLDVPCGGLKGNFEQQDAFYQITPWYIAAARSVEGQAGTYTCLPLYFRESNSTAVRTPSPNSYPYFKCRGINI